MGSNPGGSSSREGLIYSLVSVDSEIDDLRNQVLGMGGLVEQQIADALSVIFDGDGTLGQAVHQKDPRVNALEVKIDQECARMLVRRQPAAGDLRFVVAVIKTITDLEPIGCHRFTGKGKR